MTTQQQQEALDYFRRNAGDWRAKAEGAGSTRVNVVEQRNGNVLQPEMLTVFDVVAEALVGAPSGSEHLSSGAHRGVSIL